MSVFVFWEPAQKEWPLMFDRLAVRCGGRIHATHQIDLTRAAFASLVYDLYPDADRGHIGRKVAELLEHGEPSLLAVHCTCETPDRVKAELRTLTMVGGDRFIACHASSTPEEGAYMAEVLFTPSMFYVKRRTAPLPRSGFIELIDRAKATIRDLGLDPRDVCVVGGAALEAAGIRECTDLDFTVLRRDRTWLGDGSEPLAPGVDLVTVGYHRAAHGMTVSDNQLITDPRLHHNLLGLKFANLEIVRDRKDHDRRPKDVADVELIDAVRA